MFQSLWRTTLRSPSLYPHRYYARQGIPSTTGLTEYGLLINFKYELLFEPILGTPLGVEEASRQAAQWRESWWGEREWRII